MPTLVSVLTSAPASLAAVALLLRYGPSAALILIAGIVAILAGDKRASRAQAVLTMFTSKASCRGEGKGNAG
jgi:hypothetical protein